MNLSERPQETNSNAPEQDIPSAAPTSPAEQPTVPNDISAANGGDIPSPTPLPQKPDRRKQVKKLLIGLVIAMVVLFLLNLIPFDQLAQSAIDKMPEETVPVVTYSDEYFYTPDYEEDITKDENYLTYDRFLTFSRGGESFGVTAETAADLGPVCVLFQEYMESLMAGDTEKCNSLFTDEYIDEKGGFSFAPQKVYDMKVTVVRSETLTEGDVNGEYKGYTVYYCEVAYKLYQNNGTLRREFYQEGDIVPQIFEVLEKDGVAKINQINNIRSVNGANSDSSKGGQIVMYVIWIVAIILAVLAEAQTAAITAIWFVPGAIVSLILALCDVTWQIQVLVFVLLSLVLLLFGLLFVRKRIKKVPHTPTNADRIIGMEGKVTEEINAIASTGEVKVDGKRWTARSADGSVIADGTIVRILRIEGVKVIVEKK